MTYLHCLHHLQAALSATAPLLLARYRAISFPGSTTDIHQDQSLTELLRRLRLINERIGMIQHKLRLGQADQECEAEWIQDVS